MKSMPLSQLPWEAQLLFWVLMLLVSVGFGVATWFLIRHVNGQDKINQDVQAKFDALSKKMEDQKTAFSDSKFSVFRELEEIRKNTLGVRQSTLEDVVGMKSDIAEIKQIGKAVETHQTVLKSIIVKLQNITIIKSQQDDKKPT